MQYIIAKTGDGSHTLYVPEIDEYYHSIYGAIQESEYVFIKCGQEFSAANPVRIFEAGFGTGLNALLACISAEAGRRTVIYTSIEKHPLPERIITSLNHAAMLGEEAKHWFELIHSCEWNRPAEITKNFILHKICGDLISDDLEGFYDLIFFDAFSPGRQPDIWAPEVIRKISRITVPGGIFMTYSAKGEVKRALRANGFRVSLLPGPAGKRHILRAFKS